MFYIKRCVFDAKALEKIVKEQLKTEVKFMPYDKDTLKSDLDNFFDPEKGLILFISLEKTTSYLKQLKTIYSYDEYTEFIVVITSVSRKMFLKLGEDEKNLYKDTYLVVPYSTTYSNPANVQFIQFVNDLYGDANTLIDFQSIFYYEALMLMTEIQSINSRKDQLEALANLAISTPEGNFQTSVIR